MEGYVVEEASVAARTEPGDTATARVTIDESSGCPRLVQRVVRFSAGRSRPRKLEGRQELLYVVSGRGTLRLGGAEHGLEPETGAFVVAGEEYTVENTGPDELVLVAVSAPQEEQPEAAERRTVRYHEQPKLPAGKDREFRHLVDRNLGCHEVTQFMGLIPPGRAPMHSHTYDEVIYVLEGSGVLHLDGAQTPIAAGTCIHLPPLVEHCLENVGANKMRVLGVFHPQGDPASRAYEGAE